MNSSGTSVTATVLTTAPTTRPRLTPSAALAYSTTYTATVSGAKDSAGDPMSSAFLGRSRPRPPAPTVTSETPATGATGCGVQLQRDGDVQRGGAVLLDHAVRSCSKGRAALSDGDGRLQQLDEPATLTPSSLLANSTTYTATISGVTDAAGHTMASPFTWSFTTDSAAGGDHLLAGIERDRMWPFRRP